MRDAFTACYTTIMATAAVLDAKYKDNRRLELDRRITEAKDGLAELMEQSVALELAQATESCFPISYSDNEPPLDALEALYSICVKPEVLFRESEDVNRRRRRRKFMEQMLGLLKGREGRAKWQPSPAVPPEMAEMDEFLANEELDAELIMREPISEVHMSKISTMVEDLVDRLLLEAYRDETGEISPTMNSLDSAWNAIRMLRSDGYPRYAAPSLDIQYCIEARCDLNDTNKQIMGELGTLRTNTPMAYLQYKRKRIHFVAKICYNLLISPVPPDIHNYNALISGLSRIGERSLAQAVVDSFLFKSHLRPTPMTMVCLLQHFRLKKDVVGFYSIVRRLVAHDPRGIGLRRKRIEEVEEFEVLQKWARQSDVAAFDGFIIERANFDRQLFGALLDGLIDFKQTVHAARVFVACLREGWATSSRYLREVVVMCVSHLDRRAAQILVQGFLHHIDVVVSHILDDSFEESQGLPYAILHLLDLLEVGSTLERKSPDLSSVNYTDSSRLARLKRALWMRITLYELQDTALCASQVQRVLDSREEHLDELSGTLETIANRGTKRRRFKMVANLEWLSEQSDKQARKSRWLMLSALPFRERRKLRISGRRTYNIADMSTSKIVAHWAQYLRSLARQEPEPEPATVSEDPAADDDWEQLSAAIYSTGEDPQTTEDQSSFDGASERLSGSRLQVVGSA